MLLFRTHFDYLVRFSLLVNVTSAVTYKSDRQRRKRTKSNWISILIIINCLLDATNNTNTAPCVNIHTYIHGYNASRNWHFGSTTILLLSQQNTRDGEKEVVYYTRLNLCQHVNPIPVNITVLLWLDALYVRSHVLADDIQKLQFFLKNIRRY